MMTEFGNLAVGTVFNYDGKEWRKEFTNWENPPTATQGVLKENIGKPHTKASPQYGGQFQPALSIFLLNELVVSVY